MGAFPLTHISRLCGLTNKKRLQKVSFSVATLPAQGGRQKVAQAVHSPAERLGHLTARAATQRHGGLRSRRLACGHRQVCQDPRRLLTDALRRETALVGRALAAESAAQEGMPLSVQLLDVRRRRINGAQGSRAPLQEFAFATMRSNCWQGFLRSEPHRHADHVMQQRLLPLLPDLRACSRSCLRASRWQRI